MSYDFSLYLKALPTLTAEQFSEVCNKFGFSGEFCPDFTLDGSLFPLCAKLGGIFEDDSREYLAACEYIRSQTEEAQSYELSAQRKKWWQLKKPKSETVEIAAGSEDLFFSCGIDSLEITFALLIAYALAGKDGILVDPQKHDDYVAVGQSGIEKWLRKALDELKATPPDRLLLHEFDEWI